jgi:hypothetical protein
VPCQWWGDGPAEAERLAWRRGCADGGRKGATSLLEWWGWREGDVAGGAAWNDWLEARWCGHGGRGARRLDAMLRGKLEESRVAWGGASF